MANDIVEVYAWGKRIGALIESADRPGFYLFEYDLPNIRDREFSPLFMGVGTKQVFEFPALATETFYGLPGMIADALPDRFGNALIDHYMEERQGLPRESITTLDRLLYTGKRAMGVLEFAPAMPVTPVEDHALAMSSLVEDARRAIRGEFREIAADLIQIGTSAGGARPKAVIGWNRETKDIVAGQFDVPEGYEHWLLKFDGVGEDRALGGAEGYGRIEYTYYEMAQEAKIDMSECDLLLENDRAHFMTKRFDRINNHKLHMQSFCAIDHRDFNIPYTVEYDSIFRIALILGVGYRGKEQLFRRMVFNVLTNNCDDHTKNFSFLMSEDGEWSLAPAYDVTHAHNPDSDKWTRQHQILINGKAKPEEISRQDLMAVAVRNSIKNPGVIIDEIAEAATLWGELSKANEVPLEQQQQISSEIEKQLSIMGST